MAELTIRTTVWQEFKAVAQKQRKRPEALAEQVLKDYVQQIADDELLRRSMSEARKAPFRSGDAVQVVRDYRRKRARKS
ncbi:MAG TPA: hypothetical protein VND64_16470 [Pirellulales bacterium]|nr:hypothetical protein [Pirellulales bacterium]